MITRIEFKSAYFRCRKDNKEFALYVYGYTYRTFWVSYERQNKEPQFIMTWLHQHIIGEILTQHSCLKIEASTMNSISEMTNCYSMTDCVSYAEGAAISYTMNVPTSKGCIPISLACKTQATPVTKEKGNNPMYYDYRDNLLPAQQYLLKRASTVEDKLTSVAYEKFLQKPAAPENAQELVDAIKAGDFKILTKADEQYDRYANFYGNIIWSASFKRDQAGYDAAIKDIKAEYTKTKDTIIVGDGAAGLAALNTFETYAV